MSHKISLLDDSSDSDEAGFKINKSYANRYDKWRHKEELQKLKDQGVDESSSSESEEEEVEIEEDFLKTLSMLKSKDPKIYDKNITFFQDTGKKESGSKKLKKPKPMFMKDYERKLILERNGELSSDDEQTPHQGPTYSEEQEKLKESFKEALNVSSDDEDDGLLKVKRKSEAETKDEEADYLLWLKGQKEKVSEDTEKDMSYLHRFWNDPKIDEDEKFLKDYILNKKYIVKDKSAGVSGFDDLEEDPDVLSEDEKEGAQQDLFEHKYNFRFEEPDTDFIKRYPRTVGDSLRRSDNKRKLRREEHEERKRQEKQQRQEELKRLKALKRKEIEEKFEKLKEVSGYEELDMDALDMESEFDPEKHDQKMNKLFGDNYYNVKEDKLPEFEHDEEIDDENWDNWIRNDVILRSDKDCKWKKQKTQVMNAEHDSAEDDEPSKKDPKLEFQKEMIESIHGSKKRVKKKSLFAKILSQEKPLFDPDGKSFEDYLDEYYRLDYEDVIGDLPVRFKYRKVVPNDFGLSVEEILTADDKELNKWCSVKKAFQYRNKDEEEYDVQAYKKKAQNLFSKRKIFTSLFKEEDDEKDDIEADNAESVSSAFVVKQKNDKKKKRKRSESDDVDQEASTYIPNEETVEVGQDDESIETQPKENRKKKKKNKKKLDELEKSIDDESVVEQTNQEDDIKETGVDNLVSKIGKKGKKKGKKNVQALETGEEASAEIVAKVIFADEMKSEQEIGKNEGDNVNTSTKRKRKRERRSKGQKASFDSSTTVNRNTSETNLSNKKKHSKKIRVETKPAISDLRLKAFGINPKKFKHSRHNRFS